MIELIFQKELILIRRIDQKNVWFVIIEKYYDDNDNENENENENKNENENEMMN